MSLPRRQFLRSSASLVAGSTLSISLGRLMAQSTQQVAAGDAPPPSGSSPRFGKLLPTRDESSGLPLLLLPDGFRYTSFGWTGSQMHDGHATPASHDGMAVIRQDGDLLTLVRNHELPLAGKPIGPTTTSYDVHGMGGCTNLTFNCREGKFEKSWVSLSGTSNNCAGGATPWGTWLSCEEIVEGKGEGWPRDDSGKRLTGDPDTPLFEQSHGWIFEVPAEGTSQPVPLKGMGRFVHEAVAVDPRTGIVYLTEDCNTAGFYRFLPHTPGKLVAGGELQMLAVSGADDLRGGFQRGDKFAATWITIADPERHHSPNTQDQLGVFQQGKSLGGATFARLEGCSYFDDGVYITATSGGAREAGQVWRYSPDDQTIELLFESPASDVLLGPDNLTVSSTGCVVLCEDSDVIPQRLLCLTRDGDLFPLAENQVVLHGERGHRGDFRTSEWAGVCFSPDGEWLFVNIQVPGITFAITGPWSDGGIL